jgi:hypothetical protein
MVSNWAGRMINLGTARTKIQRCIIGPASQRIRLYGNGKIVGYRLSVTSSGRLRKTGQVFLSPLVVTDA